MVIFAVIIASLTFILSIVVKVIGFITQSRIVYNTKRIAGISLGFSLATLLSYILWMVHGIINNDTVLIYGQGFGILTTGIIIGLLLYNKRKNGNYRRFD